MAELLYSYKGITIERCNRGNSVFVTVKGDGKPIHKYYFLAISEGTYASPFISWTNLSCCGGWTYDESYLLRAVQEGTKLCSGVCFHDKDEADSYVASLPSDILYHRYSPWNNGPYWFYNIDVLRTGAIKDYIDLEQIRKTYELLGVRDLDFTEITEYCSIPMIDLVRGYKGFDYANAGTDTELVVTGLLLGYPPESTSSIL